MNKFTKIIINTSITLLIVLIIGLFGGMELNPDLFPQNLTHIFWCIVGIIILVCVKCHLNQKH